MAHLISCIFILLILYQFKHYIADYPLQGKYMLGKFKPGWDFLGPLTAHCAVHGAFTFVIALFVRPDIALELALFDFGVHFMMDRVKASPKWLGRYKNFSGNEYGFLSNGFNIPKAAGMIVRWDDVEKQSTCHGEIKVSPVSETELKSIFKSNTLFWWALGLDQMVHHLTHYYIIWRLVN